MRIICVINKSTFSVEQIHSLYGVNSRGNKLVFVSCCCFGIFRVIFVFFFILSYFKSLS